jgi:5-formyltetrahydrofolate cyclo-ligase
MDTRKSGIRLTLHAALKATHYEDRERWSASVRSGLLNAAAWAQARTVMLFAALRYEPDLVPLLELETGKRLLFPALEENVIVAREARSAGDLVAASNGIREPASDRCPVVPAEEIDLVMVPGLGFGRDGTRLGRGKGHYDRFLERLAGRAVLCGTCFGCQVSDTLPAEPHDVPMQALMTETGWTELNSSTRPSAP